MYLYLFKSTIFQNKTVPETGSNLRGLDLRPRRVWFHLRSDSSGIVGPYHPCDPVVTAGAHCDPGIMSSACFSQHDPSWTSSRFLPTVAIVQTWSKLWNLAGPTRKILGASQPQGFKQMAPKEAQEPRTTYFFPNNILTWKMNIIL
jgi:hypothetical protein